MADEETCLDNFVMEDAFTGTPALAIEGIAELDTFCPLLVTDSDSLVLLGLVLVHGGVGGGGEVQLGNVW